MTAGITGKYCAGKDAVSSLLLQRGFSLVDEDDIGHRALEANRDAVIRAFGDAVRSSGGAVDRAKLGSIVFSNQDKLRSLEKIVHPWMVAETARELEGIAGGNAVVNAAILFRMGLHTLCDFIIVVKAPLIFRVLRGLRRDGRGLRHVLGRMKNQPSSDIHGHFLKKTGVSVDMYTVWNAMGRNTIVRQVSRILTHKGISGR